MFQNLSNAWNKTHFETSVCQPLLALLASCWRKGPLVMPGPCPSPDLCSSHVPALCMKDVDSSLTPFLELSMLSAFLLLISFPEIFLMPTALGEGAAHLAGTVLLGSGSVTASGLVKPAHTWNKLAKTANSANLEAPDEKVCASPPLQGALLLFCDFWAF